VGEGLLEGNDVKMDFVLYRPQEDDEEGKRLSFALEEVEMQDMTILGQKGKHHSQYSL
jgi:hypothetical protein